MRLPELQWREAVPEPALSLRNVTFRLDDPRSKGYARGIHIHLEADA